MKALANNLDSNLSKLMTVDKIHITNFTHKWAEHKKVAKAEKISNRQSIKNNNTKTIYII